MERGASQEQLAAKLQLLGYSIGQKAVSRMETGDRVATDYELVLLARALGVSPLRLLERRGAAMGEKKEPDTVRVLFSCAHSAA